MKALRISENLALKLWRAPLERWPKTDRLAGRTNRILRRPNKSLKPLVCHPSGDFSTRSSTYKSILGGCSKRFLPYWSELATELVSVDSKDRALRIYPARSTNSCILTTILLSKETLASNLSQDLGKHLLAAYSGGQRSIALPVSDLPGSLVARPQLARPLHSSKSCEPLRTLHSTAQSGTVLHGSSNLAQKTGLDFMLHLIECWSWPLNRSIPTLIFTVPALPDVKA
jgi:hypothetical protein